jgi:hypothetical protein
MRASEIFRNCRTIPRYLLYPSRCSLGTAIIKHSEAAGIDYNFQLDFIETLVKRPSIVNPIIYSLLRSKIVKRDFL